jgi:hypothetical protein
VTSIPAVHHNLSLLALLALLALLGDLRFDRYASLGKSSRILPDSAFFC